MTNARMSKECPMSNEQFEKIGRTLGHCTFAIRALIRHSCTRHSCIAVLLLFLAGCGYSQKEIFPEQYQTVAVPIFENRTFYRHVENDLTEALIKQIEDRTPYKVVAPGAADTILQGTITGVEQRQLARRPDGGVPEELEVAVTVNFEWKDLASGETLVSRRGFEAIGRYVPARPVGEQYATAQHTAVKRMAEDMVSTLAAEW